MEATPVPAEVEIRPMSLSDVVSNTFSVYGKGFLRFAAIAILANIMIWVASIWWRDSIFSSYYDEILNGGIIEREPTSIMPASMYIGFFIVIIITAILTVWMSGVVAHLGSVIHFRGYPALGLSMRRGKNRVLRMIGLYLLFVLMTLIPMVLFTFILVAIVTYTHYVVVIALFLLVFAVSIFFSVKLAFLSQAVFIENCGISQALSRSWNLSKNFWWRTFGCILVFVVIGLVMSLALAFIPFIGQILAAIIATPIQIIGMTLIYWDLRARQEGVTLDTIQAELDTSKG